MNYLKKVFGGALMLDLAGHEQLLLGFGQPFLYPC
jgi:hypothetical protein